MTKHQYKPEYAAAAFKMCAERGADESMLGIAFGVPEEIVYQWKARHVDFYRAVETGREIAWMKVAQSLIVSAANGSPEAQEFCRNDPYSVYGVNLRQGRLEATFH